MAPLDEIRRTVDAIAERAKQQQDSPESGVKVPEDQQVGQGLAEQQQPIAITDLRPQEEFRVPPPSPAPRTAALEGQLETQATQQQDDFTRRLETRARESERATAQSLEQFLEARFGAKGETQLRAEAEQAAGLDEVGLELKDINNQLLQEQVGLRRQIEEIEKNREGKFGGAIQQDINKARTESLRRQADLSVVQMGIQGRFDSAKAIADRAVAVAIEQQSNELAVRQFAYNENKELFTKSEQRLFETQLGNRERAIKKDQDRLQQISDLSINALSNGAPPEVIVEMRKAETLSDAIRIGGHFVDKLQRDQALLQRQKINLELKKLNQELNPGTTEIDLAEVDAWVANIRGGQASFSDVKDERVKSLVSIGLAAQAGDPDAKNLDKLINRFDETSGILSAKGLDLAVGASFVTRGSPGQRLINSFTGQREEVVGSVAQLMSQETLDSLIAVKKDGATFGALSDGERTELANARTKLSQWAAKDEAGKITHFDVSERAFKKEVDRFNEIAQKALFNEGVPLDRIGLVQDPKTGRLYREDYRGMIVEPEWGEFNQ